MPLEKMSVRVDLPDRLRENPDVMQKAELQVLRQILRMVTDGQWVVVHSDAEPGRRVYSLVPISEFQPNPS